MSRDVLVAWHDLDAAWSPSEDGRHLYSSGFEHDVRLDIDGDWESPEQRASYAAALADKLNDHTLAGFERSSAAEAAGVLLAALGWSSGGLGAAAIEIVKERDELKRSISDGTPKWIPVGERLPDQRRRSVLVFSAERCNTYTAYLDEPDSISEFNPDATPWRHFGGDGGYVRSVTHWMPLPEAPK